MNPRDVRCVIVAYYGEAQLDRCLSALAESIDVTVVDNSSSTAVREVAAKRRARYLDSGSNLGFAAGVNAGLRTIVEGSPCDVLLLNPDAILEPDGLRELSRTMHLPGNDRVGAVAPRLRDAGGLEQRVAWPFPSPHRAWLEALGLGALRPRPGFVIGAVLLLRWEAIQEVGLFDEHFFLYAEEADWQRRATRRGWVSLLAETTALHVGAGASDDPMRREILFHAAQETYIRKWFGRSGWLAYRTATCAGAAVRMVVLNGERRAEAARRARLYVRGPRRCAALPGG